MNPSSPAIDIEGYLFKFELIDGNRTWTRKWAILCDFCLYLYNNHGDKECKFAVVLPGARLSAATISDGDGFKKEALLIEERNGTFVQLASENENEFQRWYNHLSAAIMLRKVELSMEPEYPQTSSQGFHMTEPLGGQNNVNLSPSYTVMAPFDSAQPQPQHYLEDLIVSAPQNPDPGAASDHMSQGGPAYSFSGPVRSSMQLSYNDPAFSYGGAGQPMEASSRDGQGISYGGQIRTSEAPSHDGPGISYGGLVRTSEAPSNDGPSYSFGAPIRTSGPPSHDGQAYSFGAPVRTSGVASLRHSQPGSDFDINGSLRRPRSRLSTDVPDALALSLGFPEPSGSQAGGVGEEMLAPTQVSAVEMAPPMHGVETNGFHPDYLQRSISNEQRFQSFPELSTLERQRAGVGEFQRPGNVSYVDGNLVPRVEVLPESQRYQSIPDLSTLDRQRRLRELRRPSMPVRVSSLTQLAMETVKEDPSMPEADILATLPLSEIRKRYPVSGLAKRMSIAASDLLGKSHDELVLSLIQLHREKANLETIREYCLQILENIKNGVDVIDETQDGIFPEDVEEKKAVLEAEVNDANMQLELSMPLITFIDNIVKMGSLFAGNDVMFATEYRKHLLSPDEYCPPSSSLTFVRGVQERNVASTVSRRGRGTESDGAESSTYDRLDGSTSAGESSEFVKSRSQLETELSELENIVVHYHLKKAQITKFMTGLDDDPEAQLGLGTIEEEGVENTDGTLRRSLRRGVSSSSDETGDGADKAHHPRRSCSRLLRSDMTMSLRNRQDNKGQYRTLPPNLMARLQRGGTMLSRSRTLPSNFRSQTADGVSSSGSQGVYDHAESQVSSASVGPQNDGNQRPRYASLPARYAVNEDELAASFGAQTSLKDARAAPASDSHLNQLVEGRENSGSDRGLIQPTSTLKTFSENPNLSVGPFSEHIYQNEPLNNAQSTPSLFRASFADAKDPHDHTWTTVYRLDNARTPTGLEQPDSLDAHGQVSMGYQMGRPTETDLTFSRPAVSPSMGQSNLISFSSNSPAPMRAAGDSYGRTATPEWQVNRGDAGDSYGRTATPEWQVNRGDAGGSQIAQTHTMDPLSQSSGMVSFQTSVPRDNRVSTFLTDTSRESDRYDPPTTVNYTTSNSLPTYYQQNTLGNENEAYGGQSMQFSGGANMRYSPNQSERMSHQFQVTHDWPPPLHMEANLGGGADVVTS